MITLPMIEERLEDCSLAFLPAGRNQRFSRIVSLCTISFEDADTFHPVKDGLYVGTPQEVAAFKASFPDRWAMAVYDPDDSFDATEMLGSAIILCCTLLQPALIFGRLDELLSSTTAWVMELKTALLQGGSYQSLIDASEDVLGDFIAISDSEFRLIAYTQHITIDDPFALRLVQNGFHDEEAIERFKSYNAMRTWEAQTRIEVRPAGITAHPVMDYVFRTHGSYFLHVVMQCNHVPPSAALRDRFQILIDHIELCVRQDKNERFPLDGEPSRLFGDLASRRPLSRSELSRRLASVGIPSKAEFQLLVMVYPDNAEESQFLSYYSSRAKRAFKNCHVGVYGTSVILLDPDRTLLTTRASQLQAFVNMNPCIVGASEPFERIEDFPSAFQQARGAASLAISDHPSLAQQLKGPAPIPIYRFGDSFASYVASIATTSNHLIEHSVRNGIVAKIARFDAQHDTFDAKVLFSYLRHERNVRKTCEELFIHRSTLLYRIKRMQERFGFDLEDAEERERIMMEYHVLPANEALPDKL